MTAGSISQSERRPLWRPRFLLLSSLGAVIVTIAALLAWHLSSPKLSFHILKWAMATSSAATVDHFVNKDVLRESVVREWTGVFVKPKDGESPDAMQRIMVGMIQKAVPTILESMESFDLKSAMRGVNSFVPLLLRINPTVWSDWLEAISSGHFDMALCKAVEQRSACTLVIYGPQNQTGELALLWQRKGMMWQLQSIVGFEQLLETIRGAP